MRSFEARISGRLVRTFSDRDLAEIEKIQARNAQVPA